MSETNHVKTFTKENKQNGYYISKQVVICVLSLYCLIYIGICQNHWIFQSAYNVISQLSHSNRNVNENNNDSKIVLVWTVGEDPRFRNPNTKEKRECGRFQYTFTSDRSLLNVSHAVYFVHRYEKANDLLPVRFPWQRWVIKSHESPANHLRFSPALNGKLNLTMTYHRNSDVPFPIGFYRRRGSNNFGPYNVSINKRCRLTKAKRSFNKRKMKYTKLPSLVKVTTNGFRG